MIEATIIADSVNPKGKRLTSFVLQFPRIILAEVNTHRMFTRNSASSRAVPFAKMLERVKNDPFIPMRWMKDHSGMQGSEYLEGMDIIAATGLWLEARDAAIEKAKKLSDGNVTKQIVNRLLEPFMYHTAIVTATDYENFFALRAHEAAEIHLQDLAYKMLDAYNESTPRHLMAGEWHIPFGDSFDDERLLNFFDINTEGSRELNILKVKIATARCARVSYINYEGKDDYEADLKLHDQLAKMGHWSAFEHCAQAQNNVFYTGNFCGFKQYRKLFQSENRNDTRVCPK